jgi:NDP-sugar pyrophosphorylase family protein
MMKAMIYAAGLGTRLQPETDIKPKALVEVAGIPMIGRLIERLKAFNIDQVIINTHHLREQVKEYLNRNKSFGIEIVLSEEHDELLETGGGLAKARWFLDGSDPFLIHNVDILSDIDLQDMLRFHKKRKPMVSLAVRNRVSSRYLLFDEEMALKGWMNNKTGETILAENLSKPLKKLAFSGIHIVNPDIFRYFTEIKRYRIIDKYLDISGKEHIAGYKHDGGYWIDMGTKEGIRDAERRLSNNTSSSQ